MKAKVLVKQNGSSAHETDALTEEPVSGLTSDNILSTNLLAGSETELEDVEGYELTTPGDADLETVSQLSTEAAVDDQLEESGYENTAGETMALDAFFASYSELTPTETMLNEFAEVIIGADNRVRINNTAVYPWRAICALKITAKNGKRFIGTGWLVSPRTVITAGHCVYMHDEGGWPSRIEVIPGENDASRPYGSFTGTSFRSVKGWTNSKNRNYDYGAIILPANSRPGDRTGYFGYSVKNDSYLRSSVLNLSGYPGDKGGDQQWFMSLRAKATSARVITYDIDTVGGQSGSPVWVKIGNQRYCVGIHTNGHSSGNSATRIVKPVFDNIKKWKALGM
jgi:glutamyl endopeptidase